MNKHEAMGAMFDLLEDIKSRSGIITNQYKAEARTKMETIVAMCDDSTKAELQESIAKADLILNMIGQRNQKHTLTIHELGKKEVISTFARSLKEDPIWLQEVEALEHALAYFGVVSERLPTGDRVLVKASNQTGLRTSYPIGGTPPEIMVRKIPSSVEVELSQKQASAIMNALGERFRKYKFCDIVSKITQDKVRRNVKISRLDFFDILSSLFKLGPERGWWLRVDLLDNYGIQEA